MLLRLRRKILLLRPLLAALLLLTLVVKPAIVVAAEVHEAVHWLSSGHTHDADRDGHGIPADELASGEEGAGWHELMHIGHCCMPAAALIPSALLATKAAPVCMLDSMRVPLVSSVAPARRLRPPIAS